MRRIILTALFLLTVLSPSLKAQETKRPMEYLGRGVVAIKVNTGVFLSWRYLGTDDSDTGFNIYRDDALVNLEPVSTSTNYLDAAGTVSSSYKVVPVLNGVEDTAEIQEVIPWSQTYKEIKLNRPPSDITPPNRYGSVGKTEVASFPDGQPYGYSPNDFSVGDLDGDGEYEIIVKWDPSNSQDNSYYGITGNVYIDAYKLDGTQLWRIDLGSNIRAGAHYTQFLVYDFDSDGLAELICKTAPGTIDGEGNYVIMNDDDPTAKYRSEDYSQIKGSNMLGTIQKGPEYLTLFDGLSGAELNTVAYKPLRGSVSSWGDDYANRCDRFLACVAYLNGTVPSAVMCRGYYTRTTLAAYNVVDKKLVPYWFYDSGSTSGVGAYGQGNHNLSVADVDDDGNDEIIYGSCAIDNDGTLLYRTGLGHGDAMHVSDMDPDHAGLEAWVVHEEKTAAYGYELHDAETGSILWGTFCGSDIGRGMAGDIDARYPGFEMWSTDGTGTYSCKGVQISAKRPSVNFRIYWDGDLQDELLDGVSISKWNGSGTSTLLTASDMSSCNSTKATPNLSADILGDWREELILWKKSDSCSIRIYSTTTPTTYRLFTLMHDPEYRLAIAWQNAAYNQPPHLGFYIGDGIDGIPQPDITTVKYDPHTAVNPETIDDLRSRASIYAFNGELVIQSEETIQSLTLYSITGNLLFQDNSINEYEYRRQLSGNNHIVIVRIKTGSGIQTEKIVY